MARLTALMAYSLTPSETSRPSTMEYRENTINEAAVAVTKRMKSERRLFPSSCKLTNPFLFPHPTGSFRRAADGPMRKVAMLWHYTTVHPTAVNPCRFEKTAVFLHLSGFSERIWTVLRFRPPSSSVIIRPVIYPSIWSSSSQASLSVSAENRNRPEGAYTL